MAGEVFGILLVAFWLSSCSVSHDRPSCLHWSAPWIIWSSLRRTGKSVYLWKDLTVFFLLLESGRYERIYLLNVVKYDHPKNSHSGMQPESASSWTQRSISLSCCCHAVCLASADIPPDVSRMLQYLKAFYFQTNFLFMFWKIINMSKIIIY